ncbi:TetR/AcrR family transcriptional regulator [Metabacillus iocasae]|uniref:AcrR family transcriptional regulator n=1 Tax=Priestia iocasae TaxID=2291674 RepID=A0ABS2QXZ7_9BACI|nr:TetR/AcrR family transcriptional regulator [Metabacillus iocasae]MBM7703812.1 AcrR family transcriptional regulator [Metabacillus iocasae]
MNGFEKRKNQKKADIRAAAYCLFNKYGPKQVNMTQIAKEAKVSQVTIYNHFQSKEQLIREVVIEYLEKQINVYTNLMHSDESLQTKIEQIIFEKIYAENPMKREFFQEAIEGDTELQAHFNEYYEKKALPLFVSFIIEGKNKGEISENISVESVLFFIQALKNQLDQLPAHSPFFEKQEKAKEMLHLFFYGIAGKNT